MDGCSAQPPLGSSPHEQGPLQQVAAPLCPVQGRVRAGCIREAPGCQDPLRPMWVWRAVSTQDPGPGDPLPPAGQLEMTPTPLPAHARTLGITPTLTPYPKRCLGCQHPRRGARSRNPHCSRGAAGVGRRPSHVQEPQHLPAGPRPWGEDPGAAGLSPGLATKAGLQLPACWAAGQGGGWGWQTSSMLGGGCCFPLPAASAGPPQHPPRQHRTGPPSALCFPPSFSHTHACTAAAALQ